MGTGQIRQESDMESLIVGKLAASVVLAGDFWKGTSSLRQMLGCILIFGRGGPLCFLLGPC